MSACLDLLAASDRNCSGRSLVNKYIFYYVIINYVRNGSNVNLLTRWNSNYSNKDCRYVEKGCIFMISMIY